MNEWSLLVIGLIVGGVVGWFVTRGRAVAAEATLAALRQQQEKDTRDAENLRGRLDAEQRVRVAAEASLEAERKNLEEQRKLLDDAKARLSETFKVLSGEVLGSQSESFLQLAAQTFSTLRAHAEGDLAKREQAIDALITPLKESLERYDSQVREMEKAREKAYGSLERELMGLAEASRQLQKETGTLATALKGVAQVRGRWGEVTLRRVAELSGMSEHCDFTEQETVTTETGRLRPDMIVNLPGNRRIPVDAKVPLLAFLDAASAATEDDRKTHLLRHAQLVRAHMNQLAARAYWEQFDLTPEIVVLFLPGESFLAAALVHDRSLIEDAAEKRVVLATPTTLIALLRAVVYGWRQEQIEKNARAISDLGKQLYDRVRTFVGHFEAVGGALERAIENYNKAVGSLEARVLPSARKFKELGAATGEEIIEVEPVDETPRALAAPARDASE